MEERETAMFPFISQQRAACSRRLPAPVRAAAGLALVLAAVCALLVGPAGPAAAQDAEANASPGLRLLLEAEQRLIDSDRLAYLEAREQERTAWEDLEAATADLDASLSGTRISGDEGEADDLAALETRREVAQAALSIVSRRVEHLRQSLLASSRRLQALRGELIRSVNRGGTGQGITGRWSITLASPRSTGTFWLRREGSTVRGTYRMDNGKQGTLLGTYSGSVLRLERMDSQRGLDGRFEGTVEEGLGVVRGFYNPTLLTGDGPGSSGWSGVRLAPGGEEEPDLDSMPRELTLSGGPGERGTAGGPDAETPPENDDDETDEEDGGGVA